MYTQLLTMNFPLLKLFLFPIMEARWIVFSSEICINYSFVHRSPSARCRRKHEQALAAMSCHLHRFPISIACCRFPERSLTGEDLSEHDELFARWRTTCPARCRHSERDRLIGEIQSSSDLLKEFAKGMLIAIICFSCSKQENTSFYANRVINRHNKKQTRETS